MVGGGSWVRCTAVCAVCRRAGEADEPITAQQKAALDALHLRKIEPADQILVVHPGGYTDGSTSQEIADARAIGKPVSFTDPVVGAGL